MRKKELFFTSLFLVSFLLCGIFLAGKTIVANNGNGLYNGHMIAQAGEQDGKEDEIVDLGGEDHNQLKENVETVAPEEEIHNQIWENIEAVDPGEGNGNQYREIDETVIRGDEDITEERQPEGTLTDRKQETVTDTTAEDCHFQNALFIGDSRTVGLMEYGDIQGADFFAESGMSVFNLGKKKLSVSGEGKLTIEELMDRKQYSKIYFMLGMNELGYPYESIQKKYVEVLEKIQNLQPDATIYLCANMHVTSNQSEQDKIYNNQNIDRVNEMISGLADNEHTFFLDVNEVFDDAEGNLSSEYSSDAFHVYGKYYRTWADWLCAAG